MGKFKPRTNKTLRLQVIELLATGANNTRAGEAVGVGRDTIARWREDAKFARAVEKRRIEFLGEQRSTIRQMVPNANYALADMLKSTNAAARIKAIELIYRMSGMLDVEDGVKADTGPVRISLSPVGDTKGHPDARVG